jgi:hypothetical protein
MYLTNKPIKVKQFNSIEIWTDGFINNANVMIDRHHLLAGYSLSCMSIDCSEFGNFVITPIVNMY